MSAVLSMYETYIIHSIQKPMEVIFQNEIIGIPRFLKTIKNILASMYKERGLRTIIWSNLPKIARPGDPIEGKELKADRVKPSMVYEMET